MRLDALLAAAARRLAGSSDTPRLDARLLARHLLGVGDTWLIAHGDDPLDPAQAAQFDALIERRASGEPVAYLIGEREFYGRSFRVTPATLIPRPETELLVEAALLRLPPAATVLDLCTGSGCVAISLGLERPDCRVTATDLSADALAVARRNAAALGAAVAFHHGDLFAPVAGQRFALIVSNPPYIAATDPHLDQGDVRFEPRSALIGGADGLDLIRRLVRSAAAHLKPGGWLLFEHGFDQGTACRARLARAGFAHIQTLPDLAGLDRVTLGQAPAQV